MPRPRLRRRVRCRLQTKYYKPRGIPVHSLEEVILTYEEIEALRLKNLKGLDQISCAQEMRTSQSTFQRILSNAYKKISDAIVNGKAIRIG